MMKYFAPTKFVNKKLFVIHVNPTWKSIFLTTYISFLSFGLVLEGYMENQVIL